MSTHPRPEADRDELSPVDAALGEAIARAGQELQDVPADLARDHLAAITSLAAAHAHPAPAPAPAPGWRTRLRRVAGLTAFKVAVGAGVAVASTTGGLAATGHLPAPVQQVVSDGAGWFGLDLPAPTSEAPEPSEDGRQEPAEDTDAVPPDVGTHEADRPPPFAPEPPAEEDPPGEAEPDPAPPADPGSDRAPADPDSRPDPDPDPAPGGDQPDPPAPDPPDPAAGDEPGDGAAPPAPAGGDAPESGGQAGDAPDTSDDTGQHQASGDPGASDDGDRPAGR